MVDGGGGKQTEEWTEEWMEGRTSGNTPQCSTGHRPFGAAAQKVGRNTRLHWLQSHCLNTLIIINIKLDQWGIGNH